MKARKRSAASDPVSPAALLQYTEQRECRSRTTSELRPNFADHQTRGLTPPARQGMYFVRKSVLTLVSFAFLLTIRAAAEDPPHEKPAELKSDSVTRKAFTARDDDGNGSLSVEEFARHAPRG